MILGSAFQNRFIKNSVVGNYTTNRLEYDFGSPTSFNTWVASLWIKGGGGTNTIPLSIAQSAGPDSYSINFTGDNVTAIVAGGGYEAEHTFGTGEVGLWHHLLLSQSNHLSRTASWRFFVDGQEVSFVGTEDTGNLIETIDLFPSSGSSISSNIADFMLTSGNNLNQSTIINSYGREVNGLWVPIRFTGTKHIHLKFEDDTNLGLDSSGNGRDFTVIGSPTKSDEFPVFAGQS